PDNRLVAAELERRWEAALLELRRAEEALARRTTTGASGPDRIDPRLRAKVVALGQQLPEIWADPSVSREPRKALLRCLIDKVVMRRAARDMAEVRIVWRGGEITEMTVALRVNAVTALPRYAEMEDPKHRSGLRHREPFAVVLGRTVGMDSVHSAHRA